MKIAVPRTSEAGDTRVPLIPPDVKRLVSLGFEVMIEADAGLPASHSNDDYRSAGATVAGDRSTVFHSAGVILRTHPPAPSEIETMPAGALWIGFLRPFGNGGLLQSLAHRRIDAMSLELIPRTARAQSMDALSSQSSIAGYVAILLAAQHLDRMLPMMTTAAGTLAPARVLVLGAGVAGLQAIATAKRLGALVSGFDTRPEVEEQVQSLGARFINLSSPTPEKLQTHCAAAYIVVTAAQILGRPAPKLVTPDTLRTMRPGTVVVDLAADTGGNIDGVTANASTLVDGIHVLTWRNLPARVPASSSQMLSGNFTHLLTEFWDPEHRSLTLNEEDDIVRSCLVTHAGRVRFNGLPASTPPSPADSSPKTKGATP